MTLLDFARGPAIHWSLIILIVGTIWRLLGVLVLTRGADLSRPRDAFGNFKGYRTVFSRSWPSGEFTTTTRYQTAMAYVFHIATLIVVIGIVPHIEFITGLTGASWPGLPNAAGVALGVIALASLLALIMRRVSRPQVYCSSWGDYFSWVVVAAPLVTGLMAFAHLGPRYETMLAIHILSAALLFAWFPFGKLMHAFWFVFSRAQSGVAYAHKGVRI
ncbi:respiratory nitrate reductase subunit gamma [Thiorhodococcus minor]|uniref:Respiratory nitrate reductase subunit gamma n=1 Tax=Thiorhodococcus minor TaxID=57489 RepID=A0A6M0K184_9GAMM|nr:respiratory nitrate reductase subunit gamma [Thiorhodococcus minor]NEV62663.1 respiratory nitrate reductase subunit gamma [Thiorhodococcus minor]